MKRKVIIKILLVGLLWNSLSAQIQPPPVKVENTVLNIFSKYGKTVYTYNKWEKELEGVLLDGNYEIFYEKLVKSDISILSTSKYLISKGDFNKGYKNGIWETLYKNTLVKMEYWNNGLITGKYKVFDINKKLLYETDFGHAGNGKYKDYYYKTGQLKEEGGYKGGKKEGEWCSYSKKGKLIKMITYNGGIPAKK